MMILYKAAAHCWSTFSSMNGTNCTGKKQKANCLQIREKESKPAQPVALLPALGAYRCYVKGLNNLVFPFLPAFQAFFQKLFQGSIFLRGKGFQQGCRVGIRACTVVQEVPAFAQENQNLLAWTQGTFFRMRGFRDFRLDAKMFSAFRAVQIVLGTVSATA